jgi:hypothetical protein
MKLKDDVSTRGMRPELLFALNVASEVFMRAGSEMTVTSIADGQHAFRSRHYDGAAFDFRIYHLSRQKIEKIISELKDGLNQDYDVVLEKDHGHVEYDPK